ncbi:hypothetical protein CCACVL1_17393, partial [Corchorus capsularis]
MADPTQSSTIPVKTLQQVPVILNRLAAPLGSPSNSALHSFALSLTPAKHCPILPTKLARPGVE